MLHCSRRKQHRRLADCIHTSAGSTVPLSDNITLGEVSAGDIDKVIRLNKRLKELNLPFYAVCGRGGKPSFRRIGESCVDEKNIAYLSPTDLSKRLQKNYGISLEALRNDPMNELRKKVEEKTEEQKAKTSTEKRKTTEDKERIERLRKKRSSHRTRTKATGKDNRKATNEKPTAEKPTAGKPAAKSTDRCAGCESDNDIQPTPPKQSATPSESEQQRQERIARDLQKVVKVLESSVKQAA